MTKGNGLIAGHVTDVGDVGSCDEDSRAAERQARVMRIVASVIEANPANIRTDRLLVEYGLDSARAIDLIVALEDELGVSIPDDVARSLRNVDDIIRFIGSQGRR